MHLDVGIEYIIFKVYQYFHIYTVLSEQQKEYCDFVDIESKKKKKKKNISHWTTRLLSLCPSSSKVIHIFPAFIMSEQ